MRIVPSLLLAGLLLATSGVALGGPAASPEAAPAPAVADNPESDLLFATDATCPADGQELIAAGTPDPVELAGKPCGSCSTGGCAGAPRGQICYIPNRGWFGHCNIFSGGFMCPTGGWDCQCEEGELP